MFYFGALASDWNTTVIPPIKFLVWKWMDANVPQIGMGSIQALVDDPKIFVKVFKGLANVGEIGFALFVWQPRPSGRNFVDWKVETLQNVPFRALEVREVLAKNLVY